MADGVNIEGVEGVEELLDTIKTNMARLGNVEGEAGIFEDHRANIDGAPDEHPAKYMWWQNYGYRLRNGDIFEGRYWLQNAVEKNRKHWLTQYRAYAAKIGEGNPWDRMFMDQLMKTVHNDIKDQISDDDVMDTTEGYESVTYRVYED